MLSNYQLDDLIRRSLDEDIGTGDITTNSIVGGDLKIKGRFIAKESGMICGLPVARCVFELLNPEIKLDDQIFEGSSATKGAVIAEISGPAQQILTGERVALNFLQHLSGIATRTHEAVMQVAGTNAVIADTRKTTPGLRVLEKYAVRVGGGSNHRFNLSDGILIKDNHIRAAGGIRQAVAAARKNATHTLKIEVETETMAQVEEAIACGADIIMLDNMTMEEMANAVALIDGRAKVEASGNMGEKNLKEVAATGVNIISIGAITHSVRALDISLRFDD